MSRLSRDAIIAQINVEINACMRELDGRGAGLCGEAVQNDGVRIGMLEKIYRSGRESQMLLCLKSLSKAELTFIKGTCSAVMECIRSKNSEISPSNFNADLSGKVSEMVAWLSREDRQASDYTPYGQPPDKHVPTETSRVFTWLLSQALMSQAAFVGALANVEVVQYIVGHSGNEQYFQIPSILKSMVDVGLIDN